MIVLGISESHEAHACIVRDGELLAAVAEERFSKLKADSGYPRQAIDSVLSMSNISPNEIDIVAFAACPDWIWHEVYKKTALYSVQDWVTECEEYWGPLLVEGKQPSILDTYQNIFAGKDLEPAKDPYFPMLDSVRIADPSEWLEIGAKLGLGLGLFHTSK